MRQTPYPADAKIINVALPADVKRKLDDLAVACDVAASAILRGAAEALTAGRTVTITDIVADLDRLIAADRSPKRPGRPRKKEVRAA